jgi:uncharacterized protein (DUF427 family)
MAKAYWRGVLIASAAKKDVETVEGNIYFPIEAVNKKFLQPSDTHTVCPWKGMASYYNVVVDDQINPDAAWYYPQPSDEAKNITGYVAFWKGVQVVE